MKNKKIISITIAIVAVILVGVLGLSRFFETTWQQPEQVDNTLNADTGDIRQETNFDYPYLLPHDLTEEYIAKFNPYYLTKPNLPYYKSSSPDQTMVDKGDFLSYQQVANIAGEIIKDTMGLSQHSVQPAVILYETDKAVYQYLSAFSLEDRQGTEYNLIVFIRIDGYTGDIEYLTTHDSRMVNASNTETKQVQLTQREETEALSITSDYLSLMGVDEEIIKTMVLKYQNIQTGQCSYEVWSLTDQQFSWIVKYKEENGIMLTNFGSDR